MRTRAALAAALLTAALAAVAPGTPASAASGVSQRLGFDACTPSVAQMRAFWTDTPYSNTGLYIGGADLGCPAADAAYVRDLRAMGWQLMPLWVGPQAPCSGEPVRMSGDAATARRQGRAEAIAAYRRLVALGMDTAGTPVTYDMEGFDTADAGCLAAVKAFTQGWVEQMHVPPAQRAGVYGSACASGLAVLATIPNPPDYVTGAAWDNDRDTAHLPCVGSGLWVHHQRHKQYAGPHDETWNGVRLTVDSDCSDGPVYPGPDQLDTGKGCV